MQDASTEPVYPPSPSTPTRLDFDIASIVDVAVSSPAHVSAATLATPPIMKVVAPSSPPEDTSPVENTPPTEDTSPPENKKPPPPPIPMYESTGLQTRPLANSNVFFEVYGRKPHAYKFEHNLGIAGIGRYKATGTNGYDLVRSLEFPVPEQSSKTEYVSSGFQTVGFEERRKAIIPAKAKASYLATKHKQLAAKRGFKIWGEKRDEYIIHSEQFGPKALLSKLDQQGNVKEGEDVNGRYLPNIYKDELDKNPLDVVATHGDATYLPSPSATLCNTNSSSAQSQGFALPRNLTSTLKPCQGVLQPVPSIEPEDRDDSQELQEPEKKIEEESYAWPEWYFGYIPDLLPAYTPEEDDSFVVHPIPAHKQYVLVPAAAPGKAPKLTRATKASTAMGEAPAKSSSPAPAPSNASTGSKSVKRKYRSETTEVDGGHEYKRPRALLPESRPSQIEGQFPSDQDKQQHAHSKDCRPPRSPDYFRSPSSAPRAFRRSVGQEEKLHRVVDQKPDRGDSRRRSRSPDKSRKDSEGLYRARDTDRRHFKDCNADPHHSSRRDDQIEGHRRRDSARAHTPHNVRDTKNFKDSTQSSRASTKSLREVRDTKDVLIKHGRQTWLLKLTAPHHDTDLGQAHIDRITSAREDKEAGWGMHKANQYENILPHSAPEQNPKEASTLMSLKARRPPGNAVPEIKPPKTSIKQVEQPKKVAVANTDKFANKVEPPTRVTRQVIISHDEQHIEPTKRTEISETPKPEMEEREHDKLGLHPPQRGRKRSSEDFGPVATEDVTSRKKAKKDVKETPKKSTEPCAPANHKDEREQAATVAPPTREKSRTKRPDRAVYIPRSQRFMQNNGNQTNNNQSHSSNNRRWR